MKMKWNMLRAMLLSSIIGMCAFVFLIWNLWVNNYFDAGHMLLIFMWIPLWVTLSLINKKDLKNIVVR